MIPIRTKEDVYPAIKQLIVYFETNNRPDIAVVLKHRMYEVSWTTQKELIEEISHILKKIINEEKQNLESSVIEQIEKIIMVISESKLSYITTIAAIYLLLGVLLSFANLIFDFPYSKWVHNNMPVWLAEGLLAISSLCFFIMAFPPKTRALAFNLLLFSIWVTIFLIIKPVYNLAPQYIKIIFNVSLWFYAIVQLFVYSNKQIKKWNKEAKNKRGTDKSA